MSGTMVLVRHGQSEWNLKNLFTGWRDVGLTEQGHAEAKKAGELLKARGVKFDIAFTSALSRAQVTCQHILDALGQGDHTTSSRPAARACATPARGSGRTTCTICSRTCCAARRCWSPPTAIRCAP